MNPAIPHIYMVATPAGGVWQSAQSPNRLIAHKLLGISNSLSYAERATGSKVAGRDALPAMMRMANGGGATGIGWIVPRRRQID
jgi:hypothetical protein